ncbi:MAG: glutaredoxin [Gammaproteobacteria bacterium]|nr:glutaredoxin [Gammaproteobacteria bacterium]|tara:strand:- start:153 stop:401 length:249 start_codon:yes stop_codon:yes gene_type:complete
MNFPSNTIVLYTNGGQESDRCRDLLISLNGEFLEYQLDEDFNERQFRSEFGDTAEFPQVAVGYQHIGGLKETLHYLKEKGLI